MMMIRKYWYLGIDRSPPPQAAPPKTSFAQPYRRCRSLQGWFHSRRQRGISMLGLHPWSGREARHPTDDSSRSPAQRHATRCCWNWHTAGQSTQPSALYSIILIWLCDTFSTSIPRADADCDTLGLLHHSLREESRGMATLVKSGAQMVLADPAPRSHLFQHRSESYTSQSVRPAPLNIVYSWKIQEIIRSHNQFRFNVSS